MLRSFFHKSSTVAKAVEEAWLSSGCPEVFTIKVVEQGEAGFLWFSKKPAIISFTYTFEQKNTSKNHKPVSSENIQKEACQTEKTYFAKPSHSNNSQHHSSNQANKIKPIVQIQEPVMIKRRELKPKVAGEDQLKAQTTNIPVVNLKHVSNNKLEINSKKVDSLADNPSVALKDAQSDFQESFSPGVKNFDFTSVKDFFKGLFEIAFPGLNSSIDCSINDKNIEVKISGLDSEIKESFFNSQNNKALCLLLSAVLKKEHGRKFQKYRIVILFE